MGAITSRCPAFKGGVGDLKGRQLLACVLGLVCTELVEDFYEDQRKFRRRGNIFERIFGHAVVAHIFALGPARESFASETTW